MLQDVHNSVHDLEELLLDSSLSFDSTTLEPGQVMSRLHLVVSEGTLKPLDHISESHRAVSQVHGKVDQVEAGGPAKSIHEA